ncbi:hypothetical protein [Yoonia sp. 2307UL14-13]|uniref:hypothetical protein n=1 Tax=Yoonia sp. 2307UL14-13 TaxID=3126506 RepID=UPI00309C23DE
MKRLAYLMILAACGETTVGGSCDLSRYDALVGQDASVLSRQSGDFVVIESGEVWTGGTTGRQTIVFLDGDGNILSFGCG